MPTNKNAIIRYQALDKCFRNPGRKYFLEDLLEACNEALYDFNGDTEGIKRRQLYDDINYMRSDAGWSIPLINHKEGRRVYYRYSDLNFSIRNEPLNEEEKFHFKEALLTLKRFKGLPQFDWIDEMITRLESSMIEDKEESVIAYDENPFLKGIDFLRDLYLAISNKKCVRITYKPFSSDQELVFDFSPYYLKQYNLRWFLIGQTQGYESLSNFALDRVISITESKLDFEESTIDFEEYFEDVIGVSKPINPKLEKVELAVSEKQLPYILTKPIHGSQKYYFCENRQQHIVKLELIINYEFRSFILSNGSSVQVLQPKHLIDEIKEELKKSKEMYE